MINVEQVEVSEKMEGPGHFIGELKDHDPHDDDDDDIQTAVFEDGEEDDIGKFMDIMSKKSLMWSKMSMKTMTENEKRYSDVKVLERYRSTIKSLAGQLPPDVQNSTLIIKFILILVAPYAAIIIMASIPMCTPWTHDHGGFYDYVSEDCKQTSYSYYFINMLLIGLIIPSSLAVFEKLCYNKFLSRDMDLSEIFIPLAFALVGSLCFPAILLQWDFVMPFFFMITLFGSYPLLVFGFVAMMWLRWDQFEGISTRRIIKSFMWGQLINSASFLFTFTTYMLYFVLYNYLLKRRSTFSVFGSFMFRFMETFGMTILREINMKEQKLCWTQIDASSIPMGECFVFFVHCTFLSSCRAASAIDKNYLGLVLMSVSDIMGICAATCRLVYRFDPVGILKRKLGFKSHVDDDEAAMGMVGINFIVDKSLVKLYTDIMPYGKEFLKIEMLKS